MIRTLRITSVVAVLFAAVVLASVLGFLRPAPFLHLSPGTGGDTQVDKILSGPGAVDRFKEKFGSKLPSSEDATPLLVKEATLLESIINPPEGETRPTPTKLSPRLVPVVKPPVITGKFELLGICYSSDAQTSLAYIRLPDGTYQWVGLGSEIGHVTIKEIRRDSIVYLEGGRDVEMPVVAPPETASLLEASNTAATPEPSLPRPTLGTKTAGRPQRPAAAASPRMLPGTALGSAQISKEEQESLSQLGDRLKSAAGVGPSEGDAVKDKLISEYKAAQANPTEVNRVENPGEPAAAGTDASKSAVSEESRRLFLKRLSRPRTDMK
jgi:hypothetical protein